VHVGVTKFRRQHLTHLPEAKYQNASDAWVYSTSAVRVYHGSAQTDNPRSRTRGAGVSDFPGDRPCSNGRSFLLAYCSPESAGTSWARSRYALAPYSNRIRISTTPSMRAVMVAFLSVVMVGCATFQPIAERDDLVSAADSGAMPSIAIGDVLRIRKVDGTVIKIEVSAVDSAAIAGKPTGRRKSVTIPIAEVECIERWQASSKGNRRRFGPPSRRWLWCSRRGCPQRFQRGFWQIDFWRVVRGRARTACVQHAASTTAALALDYIPLTRIPI
jgi:hypothetical protein